MPAGSAHCIPITPPRSTDKILLTVSVVIPPLLRIFRTIPDDDKHFLGTHLAKNLYVTV